MAEVFALTEENRKTLQALIDRERHRSLNTTGRRGPELEDGFSPETYVALAPGSGGIPALVHGSDLTTGTGSPSGLSDDIPGVAYCPVYRMIETKVGTDLVPHLESVPGLLKLVYNCFDSTVPGGSWCLVTRDKFGTWWVVATGPGVPSPAGAIVYGGTSPTFGDGVTNYISGLSEAQIGPVTLPSAGTYLIIGLGRFHYLGDGTDDVTAKAEVRDGATTFLVDHVSTSMATINGVNYEAYGSLVATGLYTVTGSTNISLYLSIISQLSGTISGAYVTDGSALTYLKLA